ncbi:TVP38/TMEM64 family protein [Ruficoccus amylovorans]|uniref:TVP38/TMEM64 family membrane protein n=1 Tax=Ruficoccus amylovorans TaxID=1804625 RepID=A0A842HLB7_9BACT|nr:VTT domain-containing protein [Ruficoccus amylovorans]MBC2596257.1 TVP38/TMEM64 family protein [Ruficoccus amylovorans]
MHRFLGRHLDAAAKVSLHARQHWRTLLVRGLIITVAIVGVVLLGKSLEADIPQIETWMRDQGAWMPAIFCTVFLLASLFCLPADIFVFAAGTLFGLWWGFFYVMVTEYVAMVIQFALARVFLKKRIEGFMAQHPRFQAIDRAVSQRGLKIGFLLRLGPVPFSALSYVLGVSRISFRTYMLASPGMLPSLLAVVYYGVVARHLTRLATGMEHHSAVHYISMVGGAVVALFVSVYIARVARKALRDANVL